MISTKMPYQRVVLKISGESLGATHNLDRVRMTDTATALAEIHALGVSAVVVVGGGNLYRSTESTTWGIDRWYADAAGMLATAINVQLLEALLEARGVSAQVFSRGPASGIGVPYHRQEVCATLQQHRIALVAGGMGASGVSTDVPAVHAAIDVKADAIIMSKHGVDGLYDTDPNRSPDARFLPQLDASEALQRRLAIMDATALALARDHRKPIHIVGASDPRNSRYLLEGKEIGSLINPV